MATRHPVIISCAITGSVHTPSMSEHLPVTPDEIAASAIGAAKAGAAILHLHARDAETGRPTPSPDVFRQFVPRIARQSGAIINITTGGGAGMSVEERAQGARALAPELCSLNMGTMNFGLFPMAEKQRNWRHDWELRHLNGSRDFVFKNTFADIEWIVGEMGGKHGTRFEFECYDASHLYTLAHFLERGLVKPPLFVQFVLGILGGIGAEPENLTFLKTTADRLLGGNYRFSVAAAGRAQLPLVTMSAIMGGHVRVGLEDNLYLERGKLATSNAEQVARVRTILEALSLDVASPEEARAMLALKGADKVGF